MWINPSQNALPTAPALAFTPLHRPKSSKPRPVRGIYAASPPEVHQAPAHPDRCAAFMPPHLQKSTKPQHTPSGARHLCCLTPRSPSSPSKPNALGLQPLSPASALLLCSRRRRNRRLARRCWRLRRRPNCRSRRLDPRRLRSARRGRRFRGCARRCFHLRLWRLLCVRAVLRRAFVCYLARNVLCGSLFGRGRACLGSSRSRGARRGHGFRQGFLREFHPAIAEFDDMVLMDQPMKIRDHRRLFRSRRGRLGFGWSGSRWGWRWRGTFCRSRSWSSGGCGWRCRDRDRRLPGRGRRRGQCLYQPS